MVTVSSVGPVIIRALFVLAVFGFVFSGYPLDGFHFSDFHYYSKEMVPFWGLSIVDPQTQELNLALLYHNEGLMALTNYLIKRLPLEIEDKLVFVNTFNVSIQLFNVALFAYVLRKLFGSLKFFSPVALFVLYPFAAASHFWQPLLVNNLATTFFLISLGFFLNIEYSPGKLLRNLIFRIIPSFVCLWLSIITVEFAITMSPLYLLLAWYYGNGGSLKAQGRREVWLYVGIASLFLVASVLPVFLFTGHNLTVFSYAARYQELASQTHVPAFLVAAGMIGANALLVYGSVFFANSLGLVLYPLADLVKHPDFLSNLGTGELLAVGLLALWGAVAIWFRGSAEGSSEKRATDYRFLFALGLLWTILAYFPFSLSYGYPRNVGPVADRINVLGSMGVTLCLGSLICLLQDLVSKGMRVSQAVFYAIVFIVITVLLLNIQLQKAVYLEAERKERALIDAVLEARARLPEGAKEPIFLLDRTVRLVSPRARLRQALGEPSLTGKVAGLTAFVIARYFTEPPVPTSFHFEGVYWFWSKAFSFYADLQGTPRPVVYRREEPFRLSEDPEAYTLGYLPTEVWQNPSDRSGLRSYPLKSYEPVVMEIGEPTFRLGGPLVYAFKPFDGAGR